MPKRKKKTVLLVDDEELWLKVGKQILTEQGYRTLTVTSGEEALRTLRKETPDILITDVRMPVMNGFDLYQKVRENPDWQKLPIIFLSAVDDYDAKKVARDLGATAYIPKPFDTEYLRQAMNEMLKNL
ncbi:MAG: response regulator [Bacteroidota bacterium]